MTRTALDAPRRRQARDSPRSTRSTEIDVARGIAVLTMSLGHSAGLQLTGVEGGALLAEVLTFHKSVQPLILFSGALLGYLYARQRHAVAEVSWVAVDKALFLLTAAHVALLGANLLGGTPPEETARLLYITVTLACCMLLGSLLVPRTSQRARLALAPALLLASWGLSVFWYPAGSVPLFVKEILFGLRGTEQAFWALSYPVLPWFSLYLAGTAMGDWIASGKGEGAPRDWTLRFLALGVGAIGAALAVATVPLVLRGVLQLPVPAYLERATSLFQRTPPSMSHLLFFSGIALVMTSGVLTLRGRGRQYGVVEAFATLGRCWLLVFVLHSYAYFGILVHWIPGSVGAWVVQCVLSLAVIIGLAVVWDRRDINRFLTLGIGPRPRAVRADRPLRDF